MTFQLIPRDGTATRRLIEARRARVSSEPVSHTIKASKAAQRAVMRLKTHINWWDAITGGGFVCGATYLFHGSPGAGKSTGLAQAAGRIAGSIYVSSEESAGQVGARFVRLGYPDAEIVESHDIMDALATVGDAPFVVIDSVQEFGDTVGATRACVEWARVHGGCFVLVCHETKGGIHAGPRTLEHMIDCSIKLQPGLIISEKNRFGATGCLPLTMTAAGLHFSG